jgi:hypothetical protein
VHPAYMHNTARCYRVSCPACQIWAGQPSGHQTYRLVVLDSAGQYRALQGSTVDCGFLPLRCGLGRHQASWPISRAVQGTK